MGDAASTPEKDLKLVQELAMLAWMMKGDDAKNTLEAITAMRVVLESWNKVTKQDQIHALREYTLLSIVDFIKANPHASVETITEEVNRQVQLFASRVDDL